MYVIFHMLEIVIVDEVDCWGDFSIKLNKNM